MKRPSFQFYPADWLRDINLRRCSRAARGDWMDVLCILHDSPEYGVWRFPLEELAGATGVPMDSLEELVAKGVLKGAHGGPHQFVFRPRHARVLGDPVVLVDSADGPVWYSARFVRDEYIRARRGEETRFTADEDGPPAAPKPKPKKPPTERSILRGRVLAKTAGRCYHCDAALGEVWEMDHLIPRAKGGRHTFANLVPSCSGCNQDKSDTLPDDWAAIRPSPSRRVGDGSGDGSSASSSSSPTGKDSVPKGTVAQKRDASAPSGAAKSPPAPAHVPAPREPLPPLPPAPAGVTRMPALEGVEQERKRATWRIGRALLMDDKVPEKQCGTVLGKLAGDYGFDVFSMAVERAGRLRPAEVVSWLTATCQAIVGERGGASNKQTKLEAGNDIAASSWAAKTKGTKNA